MTLGRSAGRYTSELHSTPILTVTKKRRNKLNREKLRRFYQRKRAARKSQEEAVQKETSCYGSGIEEEDERGRLRVKVSFPKTSAIIRMGALKNVIMSCLKQHLV